VHAQHLRSCALRTPGLIVAGSERALDDAAHRNGQTWRTSTPPFLSWLRFSGRRCPAVTAAHRGFVEARRFGASPFITKRRQSLRNGMGASDGTSRLPDRFRSASNSHSRGPVDYRDIDWCLVCCSRNRLACLIIGGIGLLAPNPGFLRSRRANGGSGWIAAVRSATARPKTGRSSGASIWPIGWTAFGWSPRQQLPFVHLAIQ
jgi:hypothetical protein